MTNSNIVNYSRISKEQGLVLRTTVTIGYDAPWRQVHELLKLAASRTEGVRKDAEPFVLQTALSDFFVE
jgi:small-conductance mechanosensitive channel